MAVKNPPCRIIRLVSFCWGFCEATFFFLVPDIWLSRIVLNDRREGWINILFATAGALLGGCLLYALAPVYFMNMQQLLDFVPAVSTAMIEETGRQIQSDGLVLSMLAGIASGVPYKIYATWSGHLALPFGLFLLASALARTLRFAGVTTMTHLISHALRSRLTLSHLRAIHAVLWCAFYIVFFCHFGF